MFAFAIRGVSREDALKTYVCSLLVGLLLVVTLSFIGILEVRNANGIFLFGFLNPNNFPVFFS